MISKINIINDLIKLYNYKTYLEIGVEHKINCFDQIICERKVSVDPSDVDIYDFNMTSDDFFIFNRDTFDIILIDGLHLAEQVERDILNSLAVLNNNGHIIVHDTNPPTELHGLENQYNSQLIPTVYPSWNGTVWKAIYKLRRTRDDLIFKTYMDDWGVTLITRGKGQLLELDNPYFSYHVFAQNKEKILNT
jgi:hypothetical protein